MKKLLVLFLLTAFSSPSVSAQILGVAPALPLLVTSTDNIHADGGQCVEIIREAARRANMAIDLEIQPWTRALVTVSHSSGSVLFPMARTAEREKNYEWIGPVNRLEYWVFSLKDKLPPRATTLGELPPGTFGALANDAAFEYLKSRVPAENLQAAANYSSLTPMFLSGRFDYLVVVPSTFFAELERLGKTKNEVKALFPIEGVLSDPNSYVVAAKGADPLLVAGLSKGIAAMVADGTWERIFQKYQAAY